MCRSVESESETCRGNALAVVDPVLRARMLGDAIPAESFAAGANAIGNVPQISNYNMPLNRERGWPRRFLSGEDWCHSDIKNVAFKYVRHVFKKIKERSQ